MGNFCAPPHRRSGGLCRTLDMEVCSFADSIGGPFPVTSHRCHHKQKHCPPALPGGGLPATPLLFHPHTKGSQILMDLSHKAVKRQASFCNAITFSNRPVLIYEQVRLKVGPPPCSLRLSWAPEPSRPALPSVPALVAPSPSLPLCCHFCSSSPLLVLFPLPSPSSTFPVGHRRTGGGVWPGGPQRVSRQWEGSQRRERGGRLGGVTPRGKSAGGGLLGRTHPLPVGPRRGRGEAGRGRGFLLRPSFPIQITKKQCCWSGALRLGFTSKDPSRIHPDSLPKYACPDLVAQSGFWAKALPEEFANEGNIIAFWVDKKGRVFYRINDSAAMLFFNGVRTADPLWALVDVYGLTRAVQLLGECALPAPLRCRHASGIPGVWLLHLIRHGDPFPTDRAPGPRERGDSSGEPSHALQSAPVLHAHSWGEGLLGEIPAVQGPSGCASEQRVIVILNGSLTDPPPPGSNEC